MDFNGSTRAPLRISLEPLERIARLKRALANETKHVQSSRTMDIESFVSEALEQLGAGVEKARDKPRYQNFAESLHKPRDEHRRRSFGKQSG